MKCQLFLLSSLLVMCTSKNLFSQDNGEVDLQLDISGGDHAPLSRWPWNVQVARVTSDDDDDGDEWDGICGATLVSEEWVLTAAHCVTNPESDDAVGMSRYRTLAGVHNLENIADDAQIRSISEIIVHPEFSPSDPCGGNDIALLRLETAMDITEHVQTLQLPSAEQEFTGNGDCWIVGFGQSDPDSDESQYLLEANLPVINNTQCSAILDIDLSSDYVCVGDATDQFTTNACRGDSGGSMSCQSDGEWYLAGVSSFGPQSCTLEPSAYTSVPAQIAFINDAMQGTVQHTNRVNSADANIEVQLGPPICTRNMAATQHARTIRINN